jgi:predicted GIY-YIG superfamily endonuclease
MMAWAVYIITNKANGKQYVGIAKDLKRRWKQHVSADGSSPALHAAMKKYGESGFVFSHICDAFDFEAACDLERMLIQQHNTKAPFGYNLTDGGEGVVGRPMTDQDKQIRKIASSAYIAKLTVEERSLKFGRKGKIPNEETLKKRSESLKGKNLGKKRSEEVRAKMSASHKARTRNPLSEETKEKIRQSLLGRKMPESEKPKHASFLGRKHTEETKAKIRASKVATKAIRKARLLAENKVTL